MNEMRAVVDRPYSAFIVSNGFFSSLLDRTPPARFRHNVDSSELPQRSRRLFQTAFLSRTNSQTMRRCGGDSGDAPGRTSNSEVQEFEVRPPNLAGASPHL